MVESCNDSKRVEGPRFANSLDLTTSRNIPRIRLPNPLKSRISYSIEIGIFHSSSWIIFFSGGMIINGRFAMELWNLARHFSRIPDCRNDATRQISRKIVEEIALVINGAIKRPTGYYYWSLDDNGEWSGSRLEIDNRNEFHSVLD